MKRSDRPKRAALITGASRGVGAATAQLLAERGFDIGAGYRNKERRALRVCSDLARLGARGVPLQADLTSAADVDRMFRTYDSAFDSLDLLVLNASGGLEQHHDSQYPLRVNRDAQLAVLEAAAGRMQPGGRILYVTSHLAHDYGRTPMPPAYEPVARAKRAGEDALRERIPDLQHRGLRLFVISGGLIADTVTSRLLEYQLKGITAAHLAAAGELLTIGAFAEAIASCADLEAESGHTVYAGAREYGPAAEILGIPDPRAASRKGTATT